MTFLVAVTAALALSASITHASAVSDVRIVRNAPGSPMPRFVRLRFDVVASGIPGTDDILVDSRTGRFVERTRAGPVSGSVGFDGADAWSSDATGLAEINDQRDDRSAVLALSYLFARAPARAPRSARIRSDARAVDVRLRYPLLSRGIDLRVDRASGRVMRAVLHAQSNQQVLSFGEYRRFGTLVVPATLHLHSDFGDTRERLRSVELPATVPRDAFARPARPDDTSLAGVTSVPLERHWYGIMTTVRIDDGPPLHMLVDTGSTYALTAAAARRSGLRLVGHGTSGGIGPHLVPVRFTTAKRVRIGRAELRDQPFEVFATNDLGDAGQTDGIIGYEVFARLAARFDLRRARLDLARTVAPLRPRGVRIPMVLETGQPQVDGAVDGIRGPITIDTGSMYALDVMAPTVRAYGLVARYQATHRERSFGIGGLMVGYLTRVKTLRLGTVVVHDVPAELDDMKAGAMADPSIIANAGIPVLARFVLVFDYRGRTMYLEPLR